MKEATAENSQTRTRRNTLSQMEMPRHVLTDALRIPHAIADNFGKAPTKPLLVAQAIGMTPTSGTFRMLCGAAIGYGLTDGGYNAQVIGLTSLGQRIVAPVHEGDDAAAMREAFLKPPLIKDFLSRYNHSKLPNLRFAENVLETMGVPSDACRRIFDVIVKGAKELSLLREIKGQVYVDLDSEIATASEPGPVLATTGIASEGHMLDPHITSGNSSHSFKSPHAYSRTTSIPTPGFTIPLAGGGVASLSLPIPVHRADLDRIKKWIDVMADVLAHGSDVTKGSGFASHKSSDLMDGDERED